jgi:hypothetical protein
MGTHSVEGFDSWAVLEKYGHVRMAGRVTEEERFGVKMGRIDVPQGDGFVTHYFHGSSVYGLTPCSEEAARAVAARTSVAPVHQYELPKPEPQRSTAVSDPHIGFEPHMGFEPDEDDEDDGF